LLNIGDIYYIDYRYYDSRLPLDTAFDYGFYIPVRIVAVAEYFPGVYVQYINFNPFIEISVNAKTEHIVMDISGLPFQGQNYMLHAPNLRVLVNINEKVESEIDDMEHYLSSRTETEFRSFARGNYEFYIDKFVSLQNSESTQINPLLVYKIGYLIFIVVLIQVALGLPILLSSVRRKEQHFYGILMSRGLGKKGVFRFMLGELFIIYFLAIIGGLGIGLLSSTLTLFFGKNYNPYNFGQKFRIFVNPIDLLVILGSVIGVSLLIFVVGFLYDTRKSISDYLYKF
jgi:hypothetical protein